MDVDSNINIYIQVYKKYLYMKKKLSKDNLLKVQHMRAQIFQHFHAQTFTQTYKQIPAHKGDVALLGNVTCNFQDVTTNHKKCFSNE